MTSQTKKKEPTSWLNKYFESIYVVTIPERRKIHRSRNEKVATKRPVFIKATLAVLIFTTTFYFHTRVSTLFDF